MRFEGSLTEWNAERGYGAIVPVEGGQQVFVHISAFPTDSAPPTMGEALSFEIVTGRDGRKQAARVQRSRRAIPSPAQSFMAPAPPRRGRRAASTRRTGLVLVALAIAAGLLGWLHLTQSHAGQMLARQASALNYR